MPKAISPYHQPDFYRDALSKGRHRDIVGGRWEETGRAQMALLREHGLLPHHHLLDIGAGSLRLGCKAVPYLTHGQYWATDLSADLMQRGYETELADPSQLSRAHLIEDQNFSFAGVPVTITHAIAFAVFTHLPAGHLQHALTQVRHRFAALETLLFTAFLAPDLQSSLRALRQPDGVVTHPDRAPYHLLASDVVGIAQSAGFVITQQATRLPRGQVLFAASPF